MPSLLCVLASAAASTDLRGLYFRKSPSPFQKAANRLLELWKLPSPQCVFAQDVDSLCTSACSLMNKGEGGMTYFCTEIIVSSPLASDSF